MSTPNSTDYIANQNKGTENACTHDESAIPLAVLLCASVRANVGGAGSAAPSLRLTNQQQAPRPLASLRNRDSSVC